MTTQVNIDHIRHSLSHLLAAVVLKKYPGTKLGIGPTIENGFYYDFLLPTPISDADLLDLQKEMRHLVAQKLDFTKEEITAAKAKKLFAGQNFKLELIEELEEAKSLISLYHTLRQAQDNASDVFTDLCKGPHVKNTSEINMEGFKLTHIAGAYWKGSEKNPMLTRIYGLAFANKKELDAHLLMLLEAKKRDHKKLGRELDLFTFSELVGPGLPLWTPKGTIMRDILDNFIWQLRKKYGYERVDIPHITKKELYEKSGHWQKFQNELFKIITREGHLYAMKPMNCPHHTQIYARKIWSYRELPQRYASTTKCYRDEQSGELSGLSRVLAITQDDAHVFCRDSQVKEEILKIWDIIETFYGAVGFTLTPRLSLHDPAKMEKYLGEEKVWQAAENSLREILKEKGLVVNEAIGEAAFYGPKVDFMAKDSLNREWQVATIQLDMNLPERFDLNCTNEKGEQEQVVMIHAAIMGSIERYLSILIEHYAGAFPAWLAPIQAMILPISEKHKKYSDAVLKDLIKQGIRVEIDGSNETLGKRIRGSEMQKIPYILVVGEQEETNKTVAVRQREKGPTAQAENQGAMTTEAFAEMIKKQLPY
ncbi:MAG: threonine--tRNA ligase [Patescibacteria group bacterium]